MTQQEEMMHNYISCMLDTQNNSDITDTDELELFEYYKTWKEIPVSQLNFNSSTSQICYIAMTKEQATKAFNEQAIPAKSEAYEYAENIILKENEVIIAVEVDTTNMLDLTNKNDFNSLKTIGNIEQLCKDREISIIRSVAMTSSIIYKQFMIKYKILNNSVVKRIYKI